MGDLNKWNYRVPCAQFNLKQLVNFPTYLIGEENESKLDVVLSNLHQFYQTPVKSAPLGQSRHCGILWKPVIAFKLQEKFSKTVTYRPLTEEGFEMLSELLRSEQWDCVYNATTANEMDVAFHRQVFGLIYKCFPEKQKVYRQGTSCG